LSSDFLTLTQATFTFIGVVHAVVETLSKAVASLQQTLKTNAQTALTQNRARLDQSQQRFADPDPKNTNWAALRKQSKTVSDLDSRMSEASLQLLKVYRKATGDRPHKPTPFPNKSAIILC
jgi:exonuclease VII large subunit